MKKDKCILALVFTVICCLFGCNKWFKSSNISEKQVGTDENIILFIPTEEDEKLFFFDLSSLIDTIKYVKLEFSDQSIIGAIGKIIVFEDHIYIFDVQTYSLFVFDMNGNYLHKIDKKGQGPGEYIQLDFFDIDKENKHIVLTDLMSYWVMRYDLDGNFLSRQKIPVWCEGVSILPDKGVVLYANFRNNTEKLAQEYNLIYLDSTMNYQQAYFKYNSKDIDQRKIPSTSTSGHFYSFEDHINFSFPGGNTVYQILEDSLVSKYQFDFGKEVLPHPTNYEKFIEKTANTNKYNGFWGPVMETDNLIFYSMRTNIYPILSKVYFSKNSNNMLSSVVYMIENGFSLDIPLTGYDSWIVSEIQAYQLVEWKNALSKEKKESAGRYTKARLSLAEELTDEDNPVLMFYKLKPF